MTKRYQRGNQNLYIRQHNDQNIPKGKSESAYQKTQWPKDTKGAIRIRISDNTMTKRYQRDNQNPFIRQQNDQKIPKGQSESVYQTTQWPKDTKGEIRICISDNTMTKRYQRGNQNLHIRQHNDQKIPKGKSESVYQTTQWPKDTKGVSRICISDNTMTKRYQRGNQNLYIRQHNDQKIPKGQSETVYQTTQWPKDTKGAIGISISDSTMIKRYQRGNQNPYIRQHNDQNIPKGPLESVYQTTQWPKDTKGAIRICISDNTMTKKYQRGNQNLYIRQHNDQKKTKGKSEFVYQTTQWPKNTKGAIRICISDNTMTKKNQRGNQNLYIRQHNVQKIPKGKSESVYQTTQWPKDTKGVIRICISDNTMTKRYQRGNQNLYIRQHNDQKIPKGQSEYVYQTTQWPKDTKRDNQNLNIKQHNDQKIPKGQSESVYQTTQWPKDTKGAIGICISDNTMTKRYQRENQNLYIRQHNDQKIPKGQSESVYQTTQWPKDTKGQSESVYQTTQWPKDTKGTIRICISDNTMTKRYQRGNQNLYIRQHNDQKIPKGQSESVYQTTQWPKYTKGEIRICISENTMAKRHQRGNQNPYIRQHNDQKIPKEQSDSVYQTTKWPKDTKGTIRICISYNTMTKRYQRGNQNLYIRQHNDQKIPKGQSESVYQTTQWPKDTKGEIRICISDNTMTKRYQRGKQNLYIRQYNDQNIPKGKSESVYQTTQ